MVEDCVRLLEGHPVDDRFLVALAGPAAQLVLVGREGGKTGYWPRVWATRAFLYTWDDLATGALKGAVWDESWRVREMVAKVIAKNRIEDAVAVAAQLQWDSVPRVRAAADRALIGLRAMSHLPASSPRRQ